MTESEDTGSVSTALELNVSTTSDEESMSLEDILKKIPADVMLPSVTAAEITRIRFAPSIEIPGVHEGDWYKASLPQSSTTDKGKAPLVEETIKGHPAREMFSFICAYIDFLVQLREKFLAWVETDSLETAVRRREFTIAKYREMLLRKFLESHHQHFQAGQPSTATDLQIIALLSNAHIFAVETLQTQMRIHRPKWERICSSRFFEGENRDRGAVIARSNTSIRSLCWLRTETLVDGSWVIQEGNDLWQRLPKQTVPPMIELSPQRKFDDTLAPVSEFFKVLQKQWADVCIEVVQSSTVSSLQPVGSHNSCRDIVVKSSVVDIFEKVPTGFCDVLQQEVELVSSDGSTVYRSPSPQSLSSSSDQLDFHLSSPMDEEVIAITNVGSTPAVAQLSLPPVVSKSFDDLRASISLIIVNQSKESRRQGDSHDEVLVKIKNLERTLLDILYQQDQAFRSLIQNLADVRKEAKEQKAIIEDMDERLATVRSKLLDFRAQAQENHNTLSTQLGFLVDYINRCGNDKKGEDSSSRRPQPPPDDQSRPSGGSASRGGGSGDGSSRRRDDRRGYSTKRVSSSGGGGSGTAGGPYKKNAEWWLYGKNQFLDFVSFLVQIFCTVFS
ncbi:hypothetical protein F511_15477 [Dorcoceras hygrometricum]|uniref:Uncharacterized protein n=1 Tax=Dorcoceras hygrometricum TaxID=472368 RepID=A0A2Z7BC76_9LAMI|nr:hypothetical protein F511_15477 [Dorcoceras hygrometricum]